MADSEIQFKLSASEQPFIGLREKKAEGEEAFVAHARIVAMCFAATEATVLTEFDRVMNEERVEVEAGSVIGDLKGMTVSDSIKAMLLRIVDLNKLAEEAEASKRFNLGFEVVQEEGKAPSFKFVLNSSTKRSGGGGGGRTGKFDYFDENGVAIPNLKKYIEENKTRFPKTWAIIEDYAKRENSNISAPNALARGVKAGDPNIIKSKPKEAKPEVKTS